MNCIVDLVVVGGGASGFMGAITAAEDGVTSVLLLEARNNNLEKVRISGGGRCNVTHACWEIDDLIPNYPRGQSALKGAFSRFAAGDAVAWFEARGLDLVAESDGRIFPKSNSSKEVINCLERAACSAGVFCESNMRVIELKALDKEGFLVKCKDMKLFLAKKILLATGSDPSGKKFLSQLGHNLIPAVPSLFSLKIPTSWLTFCSGIVVDNVNFRLTVRETSFKEVGRVLITHKGLSGPAILRLSSFAARHLSESKYKANLEINWVNLSQDLVKDILQEYRVSQSRSFLVKSNPFPSIPRRLWLNFLESIGIDPSLRWANLNSRDERRLSECLSRSSHSVIGRGPFGEEFVTAGGAELSQVDFKSMESRKSPGLYFAGEVLDIDGVTGGFNFQHCWTSGWLAGRAIAKDLKK